jgi:uncharacterized membrane protein
MIKGLMMASGFLTMYILYGKNYDGGKNNSKVALYSFLNICWALCFFFALLAQNEPIALAVLILIIIAYPAIIIVCGIRNRRKAKANDIKTEKHN